MTYTTTLAKKALTSLNGNTNKCSMWYFHRCEQFDFSVQKSIAYK